MNRLSILLLILILYSCEKTKDFDPNKKNYLITETIKKAARQITNETGLIPCGSGAQAMDQIKMLALAFDCRQELDVDSGRKLLITAVERFRSAVNGNEPIRPYLANYPFEPKNIIVEIYIHNKDGSFVEPNRICIAVASQGILRYKTHNSNSLRSTIIHEESYEEALQKLGDSP